MSAKPGRPNRLIDETSPYLLQHAHNPVDWFPWGDAALEKAKSEDKLILVSIGYAACHWCHVMERESFENEATAAILNRHFVAIKVDREERPDLDGHFMEILTAMTGSGGWPLHMFLTPDLTPVYGGTYFPPVARYGRASFNSVLTALGEQWSGDRQAMLAQMGELQGYLEEKLAPPIIGKVAEGAGDPRPVSVAFWHERFDPVHWGFGAGNKFPQPPILSMILRQAAREGDLEIATPVFNTLDRMAAGGVRDQLGGAFHRYSVDRYWQVPHFEIMLYDNALLARVYLEAFQLSGRSRYRFVTRQILDDMLARFQLDGGCFISAMDADSSGEEGLYYTWTEEEVEAVLGVDAAGFIDAFVDSMEGTVEGRSVLRLLGDMTAIEDTVARQRENIKKLIAARQQRTPPALDDKILTSWNALMISAMARAGAVLHEPRYILAAQKCSADLFENSFIDGKPRHSRRGDKVGEMVFLDDYAFLIQGLLDLFEAGHDPFHLDAARDLAAQMLDRFQVEPGRPFNLTPMDQPSRLPPRAELEDGVTPAGHSAALVALQRLARLGAGDRFLDAAAIHLENLGGLFAEKPYSYPELLWALDFDPETAGEVIISGPVLDADSRRLITTVQSRFMPGVVTAVNDPVRPLDHKRWPQLARPMIDGKPTAYVCKNMVCRLPVNSVGELEKMLDGY